MRGPNDRLHVLQPVKDEDDDGWRCRDCGEQWPKLPPISERYGCTATERAVMAV